MPRKKKAKTAPPAKTADYQPSPAEAEQFEAFFDRRESKPPAPQVKLTHEPGHPAQISADHPMLGMWGAAFQTAFGTTEPSFCDLMLNQLINATHQDRDGAVSEATVNAALAAVHGIGPKDETEGMLATQMVATHHLAMQFMRRALQAEYRSGLQDCGNLAVKLLRTYTGQLEALQRYRGKGHQKIVVERVNVGEGGQAIVGHVEHGREGGGAREKSEEQSHAKHDGDASEPALRSEDEAGNALQGAGGSN